MGKNCRSYLFLGLLACIISLYLFHPTEERQEAAALLPDCSITATPESDYSDKTGTFSKEINMTPVSDSVISSVHFAKPVVKVPAKLLQRADISKKVAGTLSLRRIDRSIDALINNGSFEQSPILRI